MANQSKASNTLIQAVREGYSPKTTGAPIKPRGGSVISAPTGSSKPVGATAAKAKRP